MREYKKKSAKMQILESRDNSIREEVKNRYVSVFDLAL